MTNDVNIELDEVKLEELILLGDDKKIPIRIEFPQGEDRVVAKALIKQLTLKESSGIGNVKNNFEVSLRILKKCLFKHNGENYTKEELLSFPVGVVEAISIKIMEVSGVDMDKLRNF